MKKLLMICGLLFSVITFAQAQGGGDRKMPTPEERATRSTEQLTKKLNLSADQQTKVKAILLDQATAMVKVREEGKGDREGMMAKMKASNEESDTKINAVLNDDQKKSYTDWKAERAEAMKKRMNGGAGKPAGGGSE